MYRDLRFWCFRSTDSWFRNLKVGGNPYSFWRLLIGLARVVGGMFVRSLRFRIRDLGLGFKCLEFGVLG